MGPQESSFSDLLETAEVLAEALHDHTLTLLYFLGRLFFLLL
jgi:hypothetical protein